MKLYSSTEKTSLRVKIDFSNPSLKICCTDTAINVKVRQLFLVDQAAALNILLFDIQHCQHVNQAFRSRNLFLDLLTSCPTRCSLPACGTVKLIHGIDTVVRDEMSSDARVDSSAMA